MKALAISPGGTVIDTVEATSLYRLWLAIEQDLIPFCALGATIKIEADDDECNNPSGGARETAPASADP